MSSAPRPNSVLWKRFSLLATVVALSILAGPSFGRTSSIDPELALKNCMAAQPEVQKEQKSGPARYVFKGLGNEAKANVKGMAQDMVFVFSAQDIDPYAKGPPKDKPYRLLSVRLVDGSQCSVIKYPDNSKKIVGGFANGTIIAPLSPNIFVVGYPNGARGRLEKTSDGGYKVFRPDGTVTTLKQTMSGQFSIRNDKLGYMGDATPDRTGLQFEFKDNGF
jgi:hypothetical protein